jgi:hypothetical protein
MYARKRIQHIVMDSTGAYTELCELGKVCGIDKSPYNTMQGGHRHPYSAVYSMLFAPLKNKPIMFAEIGVAGGGSVVVWWTYFKNARLSFFDRDQNFLDNVGTFNFPDNKPYMGLMDVRVDGDIGRAIMEACIADASGTSVRKFDVILDDSSHDYKDQIRIIKECWPHINSGGYMIVEDVYRSTPESDFDRDLESILPECADAYFVVCNHEERYSPGWNNDKLLILVKG